VPLHQEVAALPKEIVAEPIIGWRVWKVVPPCTYVNGVTWWRIRDFRLASIAIGGPWEPGIVTAHCGILVGDSLLPAHSAPQLRCSCGLWAFRDEGEAYELFLSLGGAAFGRVQLWGRVIEHTRGWRAQHARPLELFLQNEPFMPAPNVDILAQRLAAAYDTTVTPIPAPETWTFVSPGRISSRRRSRLLPAFAGFVAGVAAMFAVWQAFVWHTQTYEWVVNLGVSLYWFAFAAKLNRRRRG
jgi:hypothetical protein